MKPEGKRKHWSAVSHRSIHPQGWVPIEASLLRSPANAALVLVAFTPKGGCPLKPRREGEVANDVQHIVAFTPKGGCPLKLRRLVT